MSTVQVTSQAQASSPTWTAESLNGLTNAPGSDAVDFVVNAFSPKYLGTGTDVNGMLCTQTGVAKIAGIGGTEAFSNLQTFGDTIATRQMQGSICADGWFIVASYDSTGGTRVRYTTNGGTAWSSYVTVSSAVSGSGWQPGLWMSQRTPGLAVVTAYTALNAGFGGSNSSPAVGGDWRRTFTINSTNGLLGWTLGTGTLSANGINLTGTAPNFDAGISATLTMPSGTVVIGMWYTGCSNPFRTANATGILTAAGTGYNVAYGAMGPNCSGTVGKTGLSAGDGSYGFYYYDQLNATSYMRTFNIEGTGTNPFDVGGSAAAYVTTDYGATWTKVTSATTVGYIQPGAYPSGALDAPYADSTPQRFVYGKLDTAGTYPSPRLHRVVSSTVTDISPSYDGKTYGVPYSAPHRRAICVSVTDANTAILCGESRNATSGASVYRVFLTRNLWSAVPTWTPLSDESATVEWRGVYIAGDTPNVAYFLGSNGNFGYWNSTKSSTIFDRKGDSTNSSNAVGLCGF